MSWTLDANTSNTFWSVWDIAATSIVVICTIITVTFIWKSRSNGRASSREQMLRYVLVLALLSELATIILIATNEIQPGSAVYYGTSAISSVLLLYPTILIAVWSCNKLNRFQTLSNIFLFKIFCVIFLTVDISVRIFLVIHSVLDSSPSRDKWVWGAIVSWSTSFVVFLMLLFMIRAESRKSFYYIAEVLAPSKHKLIQKQIRKLNLLCSILSMYGTWASIQFVIDSLAVADVLPPVVGLFNQWVVCNTLLTGCLLFNLKPGSPVQVDREFRLSNVKDRLLDGFDPVNSR